MRFLLCLAAACGAAPRSTGAIANGGPPEDTWYARQISSSPSSGYMREYTLRRAGDRAALTLVVRRLDTTWQRPDWGAALVTTQTSEGSVHGDVYDFAAFNEARLHDLDFMDASATPGERLRLRCVAGGREVAPASAVRRSATTQDLCGIDGGSWSRPPRTTIALTCNELEVSDVLTHYIDIVFGQPGIEAVDFAGGCDRASGLRMVRHDHAVLDFLEDPQ